MTTRLLYEQRKQDGTSPIVFSRLTLGHIFQRSLSGCKSGQARDHCLGGHHRLSVRDTLTYSIEWSLPLPVPIVGAGAAYLVEGKVGRSGCLRMRFIQDQCITLPRQSH